LLFQQLPVVRDDSKSEIKFILSQIQIKLSLHGTCLSGKCHVVQNFVNQRHDLLTYRVKNGGYIHGLIFLNDKLSDCDSFLIIQK
jgi:hypothetical protein